MGIRQVQTHHHCVSSQARKGQRTVRKSFVEACETKLVSHCVLYNYRKGHRRSKALYHEESGVGGGQAMQRDSLSVLTFKSLFLDT